MQLTLADKKHFVSVLCSRSTAKRLGYQPNFFLNRSQKLNLSFLCERKLKSKDCFFVSVEEYNFQNSSFLAIFLVPRALCYGNEIIINFSLHWHSLVSRCIFKTAITAQKAFTGSVIVLFFLPIMPFVCPLFDVCTVLKTLNVFFGFCEKRLSSCFWTTKELAILIFGWRACGTQKRCFGKHYNLSGVRESTKKCLFL